MLLRFQVDLIWLPEHHGIEGKGKDHECAVIASTSDKTMACNAVQSCFVVVANKIGYWTLKIVCNRELCKES